MGCKGYDLSPFFIRRHPFRHRDSKFNWFNEWLRKNWLLGLEIALCFNCGSRRNCSDILVLGHAYWYVLTAQEWGGRWEVMYAFRPLPIFYWCRWGCAAVLSRSVVMDTHLCWHLSQPQLRWLCCGSHLRPFITTLSETPSDCHHSPSANSHTMESQEGTSGPLDPWPSVQPYLCPPLVFHGSLQGCCLTESHSGSWPQPSFCSEPKHKWFSTDSHLI